MSMRHFLYFSSLVLVPLLVVGGVRVSVAHAAVIGEYGGWVAAREKENGRPVCIISSEPQKSQGRYKKRGAINAIVSHRPAEGRIGEVSIQAGYTYKQGSPVTLRIDRRKTFKLFARGGYAWVRDDRALVRAMRAGGVMEVKGTSSRGTRTTDTYSLQGFSAAMNAINRACGVK